MAANSPQEINGEWVRAFNAADSDALLALYEPGAVFEPEPGTLVSGPDAIREALGGFLALKGTITLQAKRIVEAGDIALTHDSWSLTGTGPDGSEVNLSGDATTVLRRQSDGTWLFAVDLVHGL